VSIRVGVMLIGAAALSTAAHAGSYMRSAGDLSYSTSLGYSWADREWDEQGELQPLDCERQHVSNSHYLEYGYSYYYTLFGGASLSQASCAGDSHAGTGDVRVGARGRTSLYRNHRTWELVATLPTDRGDPSPRLGCGAFGLAGKLARKDELTQSVSLSSGIGLQLWESPLVHQVEGDLSLSGPLRIGRLRWGFDLGGRVPLETGKSFDPGLSDCGTTGKQVKAGLGIGASLSQKVYVSCGYDSAVWGDDTTLRQSFSCGYTRLWD